MILITCQALDEIRGMISEDTISTDAEVRLILSLKSPRILGFRDRRLILGFLAVERNMFNLKTNINSQIFLQKLCANKLVGFEAPWVLRVGSC